MTEEAPPAKKRECEWCGDELPPWIAQVTARTCSKKCRQKLQRYRVAPADGAGRRSMLFAYFDPAYPGLAKRYYKMPETDHAKLVLEAELTYRDGWALSTSSDALPDVLALVRAQVPRREIRVCVWWRGRFPAITMHGANEWEPLIVVRGRPQKRAATDPLSDVLKLHVMSRSRTHPGALVGMKPAGFCEWMFRQLGALRGDELHDRFPGSGSIARAWRMYQRDPSEVRTRSAPSRLAGAQKTIR